jgi:hypothetical protein
LRAGGDTGVLPAAASAIGISFFPPFTPKALARHSITAAMMAALSSLFLDKPQPRILAEHETHVVGAGALQLAAPPQPLPAGYASFLG